MKIAIFASAFHPSLGGVEELVRQLAREYRARGLEAIVITNRWPPTLPAFEEYEGIPLYRLSMRVPEGDLKARLKYQMTHRAIESEMMAILKKHAIDLLHIQCVSANGFYALMARREFDLPLVVTTQGERTMDAVQIYQHSAFLNQTLRACLTEANAVTACSQNTLDDMAQYFGKPFQCHSEVVYNGIGLDEFDGAQPYQHARPYVLGIGRMVPQKGFDLLIQAFARLKNQSCDLLLAGDGEERAALEKLVADLKLGERVHFVGRADRAKAVSLFAGCEVFVLPSRHEPQGIVNLEAMACGKAVIAARVGGVPEIVLDGETGVLFEGGNCDDLARSLDRVLTDDALRARLGEAGRQRAQQFSWPAIADRYLAIYETAREHAEANSAQTTNATR